MALEKVQNVLVGDQELKKEHRRLISLALLVLAAAFAFWTYSVEGWLYDEKVTFKPSLLTSVFSILLIAPLYARNSFRVEGGVLFIIF